MKKNMTKKKYIADLNGLPYLMSLEMVAGLTGLSYETIKKHCQKGAIKACKIGREWRVNKDDFLALARYSQQ